MSIVFFHVEYPSSRREVLCKKGVLQNFAKFRASFYLSCMSSPATFMAAILLEKDSVFSCKILRNF